MPKIDFPVLGDLLPAAAGIIAGIVLIFGIYRQNISSDSSSTQSLDILGASLLQFRRPIGLSLLAAAAVHFLLPGALIL